MKKDKSQKRSDAVLDRLKRVMQTPHHPSRCPAAGLFGKRCEKCDTNVRP